MMITIFVISHTVPVHQLHRWWWWWWWWFVSFLVRYLFFTRYIDDDYISTLVSFPPDTFMMIIITTLLSHFLLSSFSARCIDEHDPADNWALKVAPRIATCRLLNRARVASPTFSATFRKIRPNFGHPKHPTGSNDSGPNAVREAPGSSCRRVGRRRRPRRLHIDSSSTRVYAWDLRITRYFRQRGKYH